MPAQMSQRKGRRLSLEDAVELLNYVMAEKPFLPFLLPLVLFAWAFERWVFSFSNWVPLAVAVWATLQYGNHQRRILVEDLNKQWKRVILNTTSTTPLEHCEWLNKLVTEVWPNYMNPKLSIRFSSIVEKRLKHMNSRLIEKVELLEFSLGSSPPSLGLHGTRWSTSGDQLLLMPVLNGKAILYSFLSVPEVRIGIAFGSGGSQTLPATELPGVSSWLVKILTDTLVKTMVEPRRRCYTMPAVNLRKKAVGGIIYVTVISASKVSRNGLKGSPSRKQFDRSSDEQFVDKDLQTFVEVELEELTRKTGVKLGSNPSWNSKFNMVLHDETGNLRFNLYECTPNNVKYDYLASCEIKVKYVEDDSTIFWAIGTNSGVIAKHAEFCGKEVEFVVPFEGVNSGELTVKLVLKEWQFSDGSHVDNSLLNSRRSLFGSSNFLPKTGRKVNITVMEGKDLVSKDRSGKCDPYVKLQYGKILQRTRTAHALNPIWNQKFEFDEIGEGEYLMIKCFNEDTFGDDNIGSARVNLEGLVEGSVRDVWIPLEKVNSGEVRLQIEAVRVEGSDGSRGSAMGSGNGWVELVLIEAKDLVAADMRGTSDPYVRVEYGNLKKQTKVMHKTLNPQWNQTLEFPDDGSPLLLHVKDHNALLRASSIGDCVVEYQRLPPNQMADKWIPLQNVRRGEIHVQVTRRVPELEKRASLDSEPSINKAHKISSEMKQMMMKFQSLIEDGNIEGLATAMCELEALEDTQEEYMVQLETEQALLLNKIKELGQEILNSSPSISRRSSGT